MVLNVKPYPLTLSVEGKLAALKHFYPDVNAGKPGKDLLDMTLSLANIGTWVENIGDTPDQERIDFANNGYFVLQRQHLAMTSHSLASLLNEVHIDDPGHPPIRADWSLRDLTNGTEATVHLVATRGVQIDYLCRHCKEKAEKNEEKYRESEERNRMAKEVINRLEKQLHELTS